MPLGLGGLTRAVCNRARRGLYGGKRVLSGNQISEDGGNKSRRVWKPNVHSKKLYSQILNTTVQLRVSSAALRTIDKLGGIDAYILKTPENKLQSDAGMALKEKMLRVMQKKQENRAKQLEEQAQRPQQARQQQTRQMGLSPAAAAAAAAP